MIGNAPYKFLGFEVRKFQAAPGAPIQAGGTCDRCSQPIFNCYRIQSAEGFKATVGPDCVETLCDPKLTARVKRNETARKRAARQTKAAALIVEATARLPEVAASLATKPHPKIEGKTLADYVEWMLAHAGRTGKVTAAKIILEEGN